MRVTIDTSPLTNDNKVRGVGSYTATLLGALKTYRSDVSLVEDNADLIHYPYFDLFFPTLPTTRPKPTVVTVHDVIPLLFPKLFPKGLKGNIRLWRQKRAIHTADAIITVSECSKNDIVKHLDIPASKVHVTYQAIPTSFGTGTDAKRPDTLPEKYFLYVGDVNANKNIPTMVRAFNEFADDQYHLVLAGKAFLDESLPEVQAILQAVSEGKKTDLIHRIGYVAPEDLPGVYKGATAYIQPSLYEGFGIPLLEAFAMEVPVIAAKAGALPEIGGDACYWVDPTSTHSFVDGLAAVSSSDELRQTLTTLGKKRLANFSLQAFADATADVYQSVLRK